MEFKTLEGFMIDGKPAVTPESFLMILSRMIPVIQERYLEMKKELGDGYRILIILPNFEDYYFGEEIGVKFYTEKIEDGVEDE
jgi:hypothetical protein